MFKCKSIYDHLIMVFMILPVLFLICYPLYLSTFIFPPRKQAMSHAIFLTSVLVYRYKVEPTSITYSWDKALITFNCEHSPKYIKEEDFKEFHRLKIEVALGGHYNISLSGNKDAPKVEQTDEILVIEAFLKEYIKEEQDFHKSKDFPGVLK